MPSIVVEPSEICFDSAKPGILYVMTISVRNVTNTAQRIRLQAPKSGIFALNYIPAGVIAPGLDLRAEIECQIPTEMVDTVFNDKIVALMGDEKIDIPIRAIKPFAHISFEHALPLGNVFLNQLITRDIYFENRSDISGIVKFSLPRGSSLKLSTNRLELKPRDTDECRQFLRVSLESKELGTIREFLKVNIVGSVDEEHIDISAQVIEQQLSLLTENEQGLMESVDFATIFFGERQKITGLLVNSGPLPLSFSMKFEDEDENEDNGSGDIESQYSKMLTVSPADGLVRPFSTVPVTFTFAPIQLVPDKGFTLHELTKGEEPREIIRNLRLDCLDLNQSLSLIMSGKAQLPRLSVVPSVLRFGDCPVNDRRDILLSLTNKTKLPTTFEFPKVATFKFEPMKGRILGEETVSVVASFLPPQLGHFKTTIHVQILNGLRRYDLKVVGDSTMLGEKKQLVVGTDKLPVDFVPHRKFVDPEEEATARKLKRHATEAKDLQIEADLRTLLINDHRPGFVLSTNVRPTEDTIDAKSSPSVIDASQERDELYGTDTTVREKELRSKSMTQQHMQFLQTQQHNKFYNEFLQRSHYERNIIDMAKAKKRMLAGGAIDFSDPFGVNMGMERGLDEPLLKIPAAVEPLWMTSAAGDASGASKGRLPVDENRLIQKKYSSTPATQAELRDCSAELPLDDVKLVSASHKVIDFGKVCVGSQSAKNFVVFNSLKHSILVSVEDLDVELQQSKALVQIIPESAMAGFDIYFSSRVLGKVKKAFTWKINRIHAFKVQVLAEVVPIELSMNKTELVMEFPSDYLKPTMTSDVVLTNPGNAYADFLWGSVGAFTCDPEKGSIAPGKSAVVAITWDPHGGKRTEEEIGLHVSGGVDQVLRVRGVLPECKGDFSDKRIVLGTMAVGTEREIVTSVVNQGEHPLVFFINSVDDSYGISVDTLQGCVPVGEAMELRVTITPKTARNYDNVAITARVRGGKTMTLRLNGSSIVPEIQIEQDAFKFGQVTVGAVERLPFVVRNKSPITATLILDLNSFVDYVPLLLNTIEVVDITSREFGTVSPMQEDESGNQCLLQVNNNSSLGGLDSPDYRKSKSSSGKQKKIKNSESNAWKLVIPAQSSFAGELLFKPSAPRKYSFKLPLCLFGMNEDKSLQRDVSAVGLSSPLSISSCITDFGDRVVSRDALARVSYFQETTITNSSQAGVSFIIREGPEILTSFDGSVITATSGNDSLLGQEKQQIFFISPLKIDLAPGQSTKLRVTFLPQQNCTYSKKLGLFLKDQTDGNRPHMSLLCVGSGVYPCMSFSTQHVSLPIVPLNVTSRAVFRLRNHGYASLEIKHRQSPNLAPYNVDVSYPDGNQVGIMTESVRVVISFKSDVAASFTGKLEFFDMDGERFSLTIAGCADNCLLSNYDFVKNYRSEYGFLGLDDSPVQLLPHAQIAELRQIDAKRKEEQRRLRSLERQRAVEGKTDDASLSPSKKSTASSKSKLKKEGPATSLEGSNQLNIFDGIDADKDFPVISSEKEASFLLKFLNRNVCRKAFDADRFPHCILETHGDNVIDCIEQMCNKKIPHLNLSDRERERKMQGNGPGASEASKRGSEIKSKGNSMGDGSDSNQKRSSEKLKQIAAAEKNVFKMQQMLNFLTAHGATVHHLSPVSLLGRDEYLVTQEYDLLKDKTLRLTPAALQQRRTQWADGWLATSCESWMQVLYQSIKAFLIARLTYKDYVALPGVLVNTFIPTATAIGAPKNTKEEQKSKDNSKKKEKEKDPIPPSARASNVFTAGENVLLTWLTYHIDHADHCVDEGAKSNSSDQMISFNKRVIDIEQSFKDGFSLCQLLHSHAADITQKGEPLHGYTSADRSKFDVMFSLFEDAMHHYHCEIPTVTVDEVAFSSRNLLLLLLHCYMQFPSLIPKSKISFDGVLGVPIVKFVELKNASKRPLCYEVTIKGSSDFHSDTLDLMETEEERENRQRNGEKQRFLVPAESTAQFRVVLDAHFVREVAAKLYFWTVRDPLQYSNGNTLCFQCVSHITGRKSVETIEKDVSLFDLETFSLSVKNPFSKDTTLRVSLLVKYCKQSVNDIFGHSKKKKQASKKDVFVEIPSSCPSQSPEDDNPADKKSDDWDLEYLVQQPFWLSEETIQLAKGTTRPLRLSLCPFLMGKYICNVILCDADEGEFSFEVAVNVGLPRPSDKLDWNVFQGQRAQSLLTVNSKNSVFEKAYTAVTEMRIKNANKKIRSRGVFQNFLAAPVHNDETGESPFCVNLTATFFDHPHVIPFLSEYLKFVPRRDSATTLGGKDTATQNANKFKKIPKTILDILSDDSPSRSSEALNRALLTFSPDKAGVYRTTAVIYGQENVNDVRCVELVCTARVPDAKMALSFNGPARKKLVQEIPIVNESDNDWTLTITCGSGKSDSFSKGGDKEKKENKEKSVFSTVPTKALVVPRKGKAVLFVYFSSAVVGDFNGKLILRNNENSDVFEYALQGSTTDALAEKSLNFSCSARRKTPFSIPLPSLRTLFGEVDSANDKSKDKDKDKDAAAALQLPQRFYIDSDLPHVSFMKTVEIQYEESQQNVLNFSINSPVGGVLSGFIGLRDREDGGGLVVWYTVCIDVQAPKEEKSIDISATVRSAVCLGITLENPIDDGISFDVSFVGDGLFGDTTFSLPARRVGDSEKPSATYELLYSPLIAGNFIGRLSFWNEALGELWYKLNMTALPAPAIELDMIESMLGSEHFIDAAVENPSGDSIVYNVEISDMEHFFVQGKQISLAPFQQTTFRIFFRPSSLNDIQKGSVRLLNRTVGEVVYSVSGKATLPGVMSTVTVEGPLNEIVSESIVFRNPFPFPLPLEVFLDKTTSSVTQQQTSTSIPLAAALNGQMSSKQRNAPPRPPVDDTEDQSVFSLLLRKTTDVMVAAKAPFHIPVGFAPKRLGVYQTTVQLRSNVGGHNLLWAFPVQGIAEMGSVLKMPALKTPSKTSVMMEYVLPLIGIRSVDVKREELRLTDFSVILKVDDELLRNLVSRSFRMQPLEVVNLSEFAAAVSNANRDDVLFVQSNDPTMQIDFGLRCRLLFEPLRVFTTPIDVSILCKNRGKWKARVEIEAGDPHPDDTIKLVAGVNAVDRVSFKLHNRFLGFSKFQAYFSSSSSPHFSVTPLTGVLPPFTNETSAEQHEGVNFIVTFAPKEYGVVETATLNILTDDAQWTYLLKGSYPDNSYHSGPIRK